MPTLKEMLQNICRQMTAVFPSISAVPAILIIVRMVWGTKVFKLLSHGAAHRSDAHIYWFGCLACNWVKCLQHYSTNPLSSVTNRWKGKLSSNWKNPKLKYFWGPQEADFLEGICKKKYFWTNPSSWSIIMKKKLQQLPVPNLLPLFCFNLWKFTVKIQAQKTLLQRCSGYTEMI